MMMAEPTADVSDLDDRIGRPTRQEVEGVARILVIGVALLAVNFAVGCGLKLLIEKSAIPGLAEKGVVGWMPYLFIALGGLAGLVVFYAVVGRVTGWINAMWLNPLANYVSRHTLGRLLRLIVRLAQWVLVLVLVILSTMVIWLAMDLSMAWLKAMAPAAG